MQRFFLFSRRYSAIAAMVACFAAAVFLAGCGKAGRAPGLHERSETDLPRVDVSLIYTDCEAMCREDTALALVTRTGCLSGCEEAWNRFPLRNRRFIERQDCLDALLRAERSRENWLASMKLWCDEQWSHVHNRKGCYMAAERFHASFPQEDICGGEPAQTARPEPRDMPPVSQDTPPEPQDTRPVQQDTPQVSHTVQPAGPLDPPAYIAVPRDADPDKKPKEKKSAATVPAIHDTPKYQKPVLSKTPPPKREKTAEKNAPQASSPAKPAQKPSPAPQTSSSAPQKSSPAPSVPASPAAPQTPSSVTPEPAPPAAQQLPPVEGNADMDKPATSTRLPLSPVAPDAQTAPENPESALPENEDRPVPGLNANRPIPPATEQEAEQPEPPTRIPPVPSMLDRPYETPAIISPQIDIPGQ